MGDIVCDVDHISLQRGFVHEAVLRNANQDELLKCERFQKISSAHNVQEVLSQAVN